MSSLEYASLNEAGPGGPYKWRRRLGHKVEALPVPVVFIPEGATAPRQVVAQPRMPSGGRDVI